MQALGEGFLTVTSCRRLHRALCSRPVVPLLYRGSRGRRRLTLSSLASSWRSAPAIWWCGSRRVGFAVMAFITLYFNLQKWIIETARHSWRGRDHRRCPLNPAADVCGNQSW
jgi:hypothetical protein